MTISAQSVVSASSEPDTIIVENAFWTEDKNQFKILAKNRGSKSTKIVMSAAEKGGTKKLCDKMVTKNVIFSHIFLDTIVENVDLEKASEICINDKMSLKLAKLAIQLENHFGNPRDIEFAIFQVSVSRNH